MRRQVPTTNLWWVDVTTPTDEDLTMLRDELRFLAEDVAECRRESRLPKLLVRPTYLLLVIQVPRYLPEKKVTIPEEVDIFVAPNTFATVHQGRAPSLDELYAAVTADPEVRSRLVGRGPAYFLYEVIDRLFEHAPRMLDHIVVKLTEAEERVYGGAERRVVTELAAIQRDLIGVRTILRPQCELFDPEVLHGDWDLPTFRAVFRSLDNKFTRLWQHFETLWERSEALIAADELLVDYKLSEFMKLLTVVTTVFLPVGLLAQTLVALGGPVPPLYRAGFWILVSIMLATAVLVLWHARRRRII